MTKISSVEVLATPNPDTLKFVPGFSIIGDRTVSFTATRNAGFSPLVDAVCSVDGVEEVLCGPDFISVRKCPSKEWSPIRGEVLLAIVADYRLADGSSGPSTENDITLSDSCEEIVEYTEGDLEIVESIKCVLDEYVRPAIAEDGGDVGFVKYSDGVVYLKLRGACSECPGAGTTLGTRVFNVLSAFIPEVTSVVPSP